LFLKTENINLSLNFVKLTPVKFFNHYQPGYLSVFIVSGLIVAKLDTAAAMRVKCQNEHQVLQLYLSALCKNVKANLITVMCMLLLAVCQCGREDGAMETEACRAAEKETRKLCIDCDSLYSNMT